MKYEIEKTCLCGCGEKFKTSRSDKKYVNRSHQVRGNNDRQYFVKQIQNKVHSITNKNFRIIKATLGRAITKAVSKEFLRGKGYNFNYYTKVDDKKSITTYQIFYFQYSIIEDQVIIKKDRNMYKWITI